MNDRELLELAAKAAGIEKHPMSSDRFASDCKTETYRDMGCSFEVPCFWNPLADDGDALRLAVKLELHLRYVEDRDVRMAVVDYLLGSICEDADDGISATRRAITRAAAEIGRAMK